MTFTYKRKGLLQKAVFFPFFYLYALIYPLYTQSPAEHLDYRESESIDVCAFDAVIEKARKMRLFEDLYWHTLVHYKKSLTGVCSLIDDPRFFLAADGKRNPESELTATLTAFYTADINTEYQSEEKNPAEMPDALRFPARYAWLKEKLDLNRPTFPVMSMPNILSLKKG